jgi:hypothetical protein
MTESGGSTHLTRRQFGWSVAGLTSAALGLSATDAGRWLRAKSEWQNGNSNPLALLATLVPTGFSDAPSGPIEFEEIAQRAGVNFVLNASPTAQKHQPETMAGGIALLDYNGDGLVDIFVVNGAKMPSLQKDGPRYYNRLFRNDGNLKFTDVTAQAHVEGTGYGIGVAVGDYDNDGRPDIFVANVNGNQLLHNNGDGTFTDVTEKAGVSGVMHNGSKMWAVSAAWLDYNNDGLLDLFVSNYCEWDPLTEHACKLNGERAYCDPIYYKPLPNTLYRNNGDGTFTDVSQETGISGHLGRNMGVAVADYDGDGWPDIFVAGDKTPNLLFHNLKGKRFEEVGFDKLVAYSEDGLAISGMGVDFRDVNNDGQPDIWFTAMEEQTFPLYLCANSQFSNVSRSAGLASETMQMSGWSNGVADLDNDGWKDLFVARSNVLDNIADVSDRSYREPNGVFRNLGNGRFENVSKFAGPDMQVADAHRGAAFADLDNDGKIDIVVSVLNGPLKIFHNITKNENHWLILQLLGSKSNRMGIGAKVHLVLESGLEEYNHVTTSVGYACSSDSRIHFGLGRSRLVRLLEIAWPSGAKQVLRDVAADQILQVREST